MAWCCSEVISFLFPTDFLARALPAIQRNVLMKNKPFEKNDF
jgi:hypothetical protein